MKILLTNLGQRLVYCALVLAGAFLLYWVLNQLVPMPAILERLEEIEMWKIIAAFAGLLLLAEIVAIGYCMYMIWRLPRVVQDGGSYHKESRKRFGGRVTEPASKEEALAYANMMAIRKKLNFPDDLRTDLFVEEDDSLNAYTLGMEAAAGGRHAIFLHSGLVERMSPVNVAAVVAHEFGHVKNQDTASKLYMRLFRTLVSLPVFSPLYALYFIARLLALLFIFVPFLNLLAILFTFISGLFIRLLRLFEALVMWPAGLFELWVSRHTEYKADAVAAATVGPTAICQTLRLLSDRMDGRSKAPIFVLRDKLKVLNSTHPSSEDRIRAIQERKYAEQAAMQNNHER